MKYLILSLVMACNTYSGILVSKDNFNATGDVEISNTHYIVPVMTIDQFDSLKIGDTIYILKNNLRVINEF